MNLGNFEESEIPELGKQCEERSKIYMLLSKFFIERPTPEFVSKIRREEFIEGIKDIISCGDTRFKNAFGLINSFLSSHKDIPDGDILESLVVDFTKLTRGIKRGYGPPPPYESVWRGEKVVMGEWTQSVINFYFKTDIGINLKGEIPDHLGIELKFMSILCYKEKDTWERKDIESAFKILKWEAEFLDGHLLIWAPCYCDRMEIEAETDFYKGIALFTKNFLGVDRENIQRIHRNKRG